MQRHPAIFFMKTEHKGRGVFTSTDIPLGSLIEICPVLLFSGRDIQRLHKTFVHDYYFNWDENRIAIPLGFGCLYNHSFEPNADTEVVHDEDTMLFTAKKDIKAGEEILINYLGTAKDKDELWFEMKD